MQNKQESSLTWLFGAALLALLLMPGAAAWAQQGQVIYSFTSGGPQTGVTVDSAGNTFGTLGPYVYELSQSGGNWSESILDTFTSLQDAEGIPLMDAAGNLYATTIGGIGTNGSVFQLTPSGGLWTETTLYSFPADGSKGISPYGDLVRDSAGN